jgi:putative molybdopterin biosynthesis protein
MTWIPQPRVQWQAEGGDAADPRLMALLAGIAAHGALAAAARGIGLSYRHAWSLLRPWIAPSPRALAILRRGEGATLTSAGEALLARHTELTQRLAVATSEWLSQIAESGTGPPLACAASHDLLLEQLPALARPHGLDLDITFRGSDEAIAALAAGQVALAGFHVPLDSAAMRRRVVAPLAARGDVSMLRLFRRMQGLIVARHARERITSLRDLAQRGVRFVNRQRGSGTRRLFDSLIAAERIAATHIDGYAREEFTHAAVAATVAAADADAGFGIAAAAERFGLAFVPIAQEWYCLAMRHDLFDLRAREALVATLRGTEWRTLVAHTQGYALPPRIAIMRVVTG